MGVGLLSLHDPQASVSGWISLAGWKTVLAENIFFCGGNPLVKHQQQYYVERSQRRHVVRVVVVDCSVRAGVDDCALAGSRHQSRCLDLDA